mmetsp:Transcript_40057/g.87429  ORF Transcript_40057/g.87429 Transcript_40057/m.87429 type:complete len:243 (-) Transcript_40057:221-949(-)
MALYDQEGTTVTQQGPILILTVGGDQNRVNPALTTRLNAALDVVAAQAHPKALVVTATGKFFSNGLDVDWMGQNGKQTGEMLAGFWKVLGRILVMDCHTVAAINGHGFGGGVFLALACDWRIMRTEKGFLNFPELNLGMRLSKPFAELAKAKLTPPVLREGVLMGKRFSSKEAMASGMIDAEVPMESLVQEAVAMAEARLPAALQLVNFSPDRVVDMKKELYTDAYRALTTGQLETPAESRL